MQLYQKHDILLTSTQKRSLSSQENSE